MQVGLLHVGDLVKVLPGERVTCDGEVYAGKSYVDESMVTGESRPVAKEAGAAVIAGTINQNGPLTIKVRFYYSTVVPPVRLLRGFLLC